MTEENLEMLDADLEPAPISVSEVAVDQADSPEPTPNTAPLEEGQSYDDEDVPVALERETQDGSGFTDESQLPAEDFDGFAEADVEDES